MLSSPSGRRPGSGTDQRPFPSTRRRGLPRRSRPALLLLAALGSGCASAHLSQGVVTENLGHASAYDLDQAVDAILHQAGYSVQRRMENGPRIYYETDWKTRKPFYDERDRGAEVCRTRIIVEAYRQRLNVYSVRLRAENVARKRDADEWAPILTTSKFREHVDELASDITMRTDAGVRVY